MKKLLWIVLILSLFIGVNVQAATKAPPYIVSSSDCTWLTFYGVLCHDTDDGKLYKWGGAALVELASAAGDGDITDVWGCATGDCEALTAGAADSLNATSASYSIPWVIAADCSGVTAEGRACWDSATDVLYIGDGAAAKGVGSILASANTFTNTNAFTKVNAAGGGVDVLTLSGTLGAMDGTGTDIFRGLYLNYTNADHTGGTAYGINIANITGNANATEYGIFVGSGWDVGLYSDSNAYLRQGTTGGSLYILEGSGGGGDAIRVKAPDALAAGFTLILPDAAPGGANYLLNFDADGTGGYTDPAGFQPAGATLTSLEALTIADVSILEGTAADTLAVVTSGGNLRYLRSKSDNSALEFSATINGSAIDIHGTTAETTVADADEILIYSVANSANRLMTKGNFVAGITSSGIILDLADDGSNESTSLAEIATSAANDIFSEPSANKLLIDVSKAWPLATLASTVTVVDSTDTSSYIAMFDSADGSLAAKTDAGLTYNAGTGVLTATGFSGPLTGAVTGAVTGNADTATALAGNPTDCGANEYATAIAASGNLTCAQPASTALSDTAALAYLAGAQTFTANNVFGNADTDTLTLRSLLVGGNSRAVWIAATAPTPTYATGTNELYVAGDIETAGTIYAATGNFGTGVDGSRKLSLTSNTALTPASNELYYINDVLYFSHAGTQKTPARLEDAQTFTGKKTFQGDIAVGDASNAGTIDLYDGSDNYWTVGVPALSGNLVLTLPSSAGTTGQYLKTTTVGSTATLSWDTPSASADTTGGTGGVQFNAAGVLTSDAGFVFTTATDKLALGASGGSTTGTLDLYYTGTTYAATITPNSGMSADVTITLPDNTSTLIGSGANTFTGAQIYSTASNDSTVAVQSFTGVPAQNASDVHRSIYFAPTGSVLGTITGTGNTVAFIDLAAITGDANANLYGMRLGNLTGTTGAAGEVEYGVSIGTGWDRGISTASPIYVGDGTNGTTFSTTGAQSFAGTATFTAASATSSVPWVVGAGTAANTAEGTAYWESDTDMLTIGDAATGISLDFTAAAVYTFPAATATLYGSNSASIASSALLGSLSDETGTGVAVFGTSPTFTTSILPSAAGATAIGTGLLPFSSIFIGDAATNNTQLINTAAASAVVLTLPSTTGELALKDSQIFTTYIEAPYLILGSAATAADAGAIRMANATYIMAEADAAGDDISVIGVDSAEIIQIGASGASAVTITPNTTITGDLTVSGADITLAAAGVKLSGANGALTILGLGDGQDEDVKIDLNTTANTIIVSSPASSADTVSFSALKLATTGTISGGVLTPVIDDGDNFAANFATVNLYGGTFISNAAGTIALPNAAVGMNFTIVLEGTGATVIEPLATGTDDTIVLNGTALTQGHNITSSTSGAMCVFQYRAADSWMATCNGFVDGT